MAFGRANLRGAMLERALGRPINRRVMQPSPDHFVAQLICILPNRWASRKPMLIAPIRFCLLPNVFVEGEQPLVRHLFEIHNQPLKSKSLRNRNGAN